jgi:hypothetical protein
MKNQRDRVAEKKNMQPSSLIPRSIEEYDLLLTTIIDIIIDCVYLDKSTQQGIS